MNKNKNDGDGAGPPNRQRPRRKSRFSTINWASSRNLFEADGNQNKNDGDGAGPPNSQRPRRKSRFLNLSTVKWASSMHLDDEDDASTLDDNFDSNRVLQVGITSATEPAEPAGAAGTSRGKMGIVLSVVACIIVGASVAIGGLVLAQRNNDAQHEPQRLLEIAEQIVWACGESQLDSDPFECSSLCKEYMCCFEGEGSCADDESKDCAVYAGCEALGTEAQGLQSLAVTEERVASACSEPNLSADVYGCVELCDGNLCCVIEGEGSCANDENKDCAVYDGCRALVPNHTIERH